MPNTEVTEISRVAKEFRKGLLKVKSSTNMCFVVSCSLAGYLNFTGFKCNTTEGIVGKYHHYWITLGDGRIVDATADQFQKPNGENMPAIYVGEKPKWYKVK